MWYASIRDRSKLKTFCFPSSALNDSCLQDFDHTELQTFHMEGPFHMTSMRAKVYRSLPGITNQYPNTVVDYQVESIRQICLVKPDQQFPTSPNDVNDMPRDNYNDMNLKYPRIILS